MASAVFPSRGPLTPNAHDSSKAWVFLAGGLAITTLAAGYLASAIGRSERIRYLVHLAHG